MDHPKPHTYQEDGIAFLQRHSTAILGDDAGLGKSMQMILAANKLHHKRILILCPAIGRVSWKLQFGTWDQQKRPVYFYPDETKGVLPPGPVALVVTLDWLSRPEKAKELTRLLSASLAASQPFDAAFIDEIHYLKTPSANRTKAVYGSRLDFKNSVLHGVKNIWGASATLTPNHAGELYTHMRALMPDVLAALFGGKLPTKAQFEDRFCLIRHTNFGKKVEGNNRDTIPQLRDAIHPRLLIRRKADVLKDLPPIECVPLPFEVADKDLRALAVDAFFSDVPTTPATDDDLLALLGSALADPAVASRRRALGLVKVAPALDWVDDFLTAPGKKLVIFAHHREVIDQLTEGLAKHNPVAIHGGTPQRQKELAVTRFQTEDRHRVFIGQTHAAGTSITLTAASDVLLLEPDWTPANNYQAISRCHRIGQNSGVIARFAYAHGTIDERIANLLRRRAADQEQLFGAAPQGFTAKEKDHK